MSLLIHILIISRFVFLHNIDIYIDLCYRTEDPHMPDLPFKVILINRHNHNLFVADAIRHRDVGEKANGILTGLFEIGHTPTSALAVLKHDLQMEYGQRYVYVSANREICPDLPYVQRWVETCSRYLLPTI